MIARALLASVAAFAGPLLALPALAQGDSQDPLRGVWHGTIGSMPVTACFNGDDDRGVYYYDRYKKLIRLTNEDGILFESIGSDDPSGDGWHLSSLEDDILRGEWQGGERSLPISLTRAEWSPPNQYDGPCQSAAFNDPRLEGGSIEEERASLSGHGYTILRYTPPAHFDPDYLSVITFAIDPTGTEDARINYLLAYDVSRSSLMGEAGSCIAQNIAVHGVDGDYSRQSAPELLTDRWLGVLVHSSSYCGGAHPSYSMSRRVFDRRYGKEVEPADWLNARALDRSMLSEDAYASVIASVGEKFLSLLLAEIPEPTDASADQRRDYDECMNVLRTTKYWDFGLAADGSGMAMIPFVPHVATPCAETVTMPWAKLQPFLSLEGRAAMLSLTASD